MIGRGILSLVVLILGLGLAHAEDTLAPSTGYEYKAHTINKQKAHVVTINPKAYTIALVKAQDTRNHLETVPSMAKRVHADIAINGGFFKMDPNSQGTPSGTLVIRGKRFNVRNKTQALAVISKDGKFNIHLVNPTQYLRTHKDVSMVSGIPLLVNNGKAVRILSKRTSPFYANPHARTAIGIKTNGIIMVVVIEHVGITLVELARFMEQQGCQYALNLDGGGSSTLWMDGETKQGYGLQGARLVSDAIVFVGRL